MKKISEIENELMKKNIPAFNVGDTIKVFVKIKEGDKTRLQAFEGTVIAKKGSGIKGTFTVRRISYGEGIERVFQLHSPLIDSISIVKKGRIKRSKLYYLRKRTGKRVKIDEVRSFNKTPDASLGKEGIS